MAYRFHVKKMEHTMRFIISTKQNVTKNPQYQISQG